MKTWFVTGASRGLGLEIVRAALASGDRVVATGRDRQAVLDALGAHGKRETALALSLDVTDDASVRAAVGSAVERFESIDVLVNNAGYGLLGAFEQASSAAIQQLFATNLFGAFAVTRAVLPSMRARRAGHVISISSICGVTGFDLASLYCASKFALGGWSESLSIELARFGLHATVVYAGAFRTDFLERRSVVHADVLVDGYADIAASSERAHDEASHHQPGAPAAFGRAIVELAHAEHPPVRFAAGSDAVSVMNDRVAALQRSTAEWKELSISTDVTAER